MTHPFVLLLMLAATLPTGPELLERTLAYHDPDGSWMNQRVELTIETGYADGRTRIRQCEIDFANADFRSIRTEDGRRIEESVTAGGYRCAVDGSADFDSTLAVKYQLNASRAGTMRDYLSYLWGLPMKLRDPGTILAEEVTRDSFRGQPALVLQVGYAEGVGSDIWRFYVEEASGRLLGYAFGHGTSDTDGETIVLEGEVAVGSARIPQKRHWYRDLDDSFLGTDTLSTARILRR